MSDSGHVTRIGLRGLRLRLTLLYAVISAVGLGTLSAFLLVTDARLRSSALDSDLRLQATQAVRSVWYDEGGILKWEAVRDDDSLAAGYPQVYVVARTGTSPEGEPTVTELAKPRSPYYGGAPIGDVAKASIAGGSEIITRARLGGTYPVRLLAAPFLDGRGIPGGAIVSIADESTLLATQRKLRLYVAGGAIGLLVLSSLAGFLLAGRSLRPAVAALLPARALPR